MGNKGDRAVTIIEINADPIPLTVEFIIIGIVNTKGNEVDYLDRSNKAKGISAEVIDCGTLAQPFL